MGRDCILLELSKAEGSSCPADHSMHTGGVFAAAWELASKGSFCGFAAAWELASKGFFYV